LLADVRTLIFNENFKFLLRNTRDKDYESKMKCQAQKLELKIAWILHPHSRARIILETVIRK
jgi:hypothetical protein